MRNIFLFIRRYFTFLTFLVLQGLALWFLFTYNRFHRAKGLGLANEVTGRINTQYKKVDDFLHLKAEIKRVHKLNDSLLNQLPTNFMKRDTSAKFVKDTVPYDTLGNFRRYLWREANVVYNSTNSQKNYLQLNRGSAQGIKDNMAVIGSDGTAVGVVVATSTNFSQVMSLLHIQSNVKAAMKKTGDFGTVDWDGKDPNFLTLKNIPKSAGVNKGDTVITSSYSFNFPPGFIVGTVAEIIDDKSTNFYVLKIKTATNFYSIQNVFVIENLQYEEQAKLHDDTRKRVDDPKKTALR